MRLESARHERLRRPPGGYSQALGQLWLFWVVPLVAAAFAGVFHAAVLADQPASTTRAA